MYLGSVGSQHRNPTVRLRSKFWDSSLCFGGIRETRKKQQCHTTRGWLQLNSHGPCWRDGSTVKSACCSCGRLQFDSQHPYQAARKHLQLGVKGLIPFSDLCRYQHASARMRDTQMYAYKTNKLKNPHAS